MQLEKTLGNVKLGLGSFGGESAESKLLYMSFPSNLGNVLLGFFGDYNSGTQKGGVRALALNLANDLEDTVAIGVLTGAEEAKNVKQFGGLLSYVTEGDDVWQFAPITIRGKAPWYNKITPFVGRCKGKTD